METKNENIILEKSYSLAVIAIRLGYTMQNDKREFIISKQFIRSSTAIGALVREAQYGESKADFIHKMSIALKEAKETEYWLSLMIDTGFFTASQLKEFKELLNENLSLLVRIVKSAKDGLRK